LSARFSTARSRSWTAAGPGRASRGTPWNEYPWRTARQGLKSMGTLRIAASPFFWQGARWGRSPL